MQTGSGVSVGAAGCAVEPLSGVGGGWLLPALVAGAAAVAVVVVAPVPLAIACQSPKSPGWGPVSMPSTAPLHDRSACSPAPMNTIVPPSETATRTVMAGPAT